MSDDYDVFLSHNAVDEAAVEAIAERLRELKLRPFFGKWHLIAGEAWIPAIERALEGSATVAVFFGPTNPWPRSPGRFARNRGIGAGFQDFRVQFHPEPSPMTASPRFMTNPRPSPVVPAILER